MGGPIINTCAVCEMELLQIGICPACGHDQKNIESQEDDYRNDEFELPYGIGFAPLVAKEKIRIPYGINHAP